MASSQRYALRMAIWLALAVVFVTFAAAGVLVAWPRLFPDQTDAKDPTDDSSGPKSASPRES